MPGERRLDGDRDLLDGCRDFIGREADGRELLRDTRSLQFHAGVAPRVEPFFGDPLQNPMRYDADPTRRLACPVEFDAVL